MLWLCVVAVPVGAFGIWAGFNDAQLLDVVTKTFQLIFWFSAVAVGAFGVWKHVDDTKEKSDVGKSQTRKGAFGRFEYNSLALNYTYMLEAFHGRPYERQDRGQIVSFQATERDVAQVLDPGRTPKTANEYYVRDCYDNFLFHLELCFAAEQSKLVEWKL